MNACISSGCDIFIVVMAQTSIWADHDTPGKISQSLHPARPQAPAGTEGSVKPTFIEIVNVLSCLHHDDGT
jgi:hypothetical protein